MSQWPLHCEDELERIAADALAQHKSVLPVKPGPIPIDLLIEELFGFNETYEDLEPDILGEIRFGTEGRPLGIRVARRLGEISASNPRINQERRITLSHECGHGLAHSKYFADRLRSERAPRFDGFGTEEVRLACHKRDINPRIVRPSGKSSSELWLEWEANYLMGVLLLPRDLTFRLLKPWFTCASNGVAPRLLPSTRRGAAIAAAANTFDVTEEFAARRLNALVPDVDHPDFFEQTYPVSASLRSPRATRRLQRSTRRY
jgi:hypothetical protein